MVGVSAEAAGHADRSEQLSGPGSMSTQAGREVWRPCGNLLSVQGTTASCSPSEHVRKHGFRSGYSLWSVAGHTQVLSVQQWCHADNVHNADGPP
jgi:hypothetical protein